jgi:hypothetical protein
MAVVLHGNLLSQLPYIMKYVSTPWREGICCLVCHPNSKTSEFPPELYIPPVGALSCSQAAALETTRHVLTLGSSTLTLKVP